MISDESKELLWGCFFCKIHNVKRKSPKKQPYAILKLTRATNDYTYIKNMRSLYYDLSTLSTFT